MSKMAITIFVIAGAIISNFFLFNFLKDQFADELAPLKQSQVNLILGSITMVIIIVAMFFLIPRDSEEVKKQKIKEELGF